MFITGITIFLGLALLFAKLPRRAMLRALKHDLIIDLAVTVLVLLVHAGSMDGLFAASVAGLLTSLATSGLKKLVGYIDGDYYVVGKWNLSV